MSREEIDLLLRRVKVHYQYFLIDDDRLKEWQRALKDYDAKQVNDQLTNYLESDDHGDNPPRPFHLTANLEPIHKKVTKIEYKTCCQICGKPLMSDDYYEHFSKCSSIEYVIKETKKWFNKDITRAELWSMQASEFEERYNKLLKYIHDHTDDDSEKIRIECIFNPPARRTIKSNFFKRME